MFSIARILLTTQAPPFISVVVDDMMVCAVVGEWRQKKITKMSLVLITWMLTITKLSLVLITWMEETQPCLYIYIG